MNLTCIIPVRFDSTRFPGKALELLGGKPMLQRVVEQVRAADVFDKRIIVATDDHRIAGFCARNNICVATTDNNHQTGTDRIAELVRTMEADKRPGATMRADAYVNVQGDEPFVNPLAIRQMVQAMHNCNDEVLHAMAPVIDVFEMEDRNVCKVVCDWRNYCLYASREPIPANAKAKNLFRTVGIYVYTSKALKRFAALMPGPLEQCEQNEVLRFLEHGIPVRMTVVSRGGPTVNVPADMPKVEEYLQRMQLETNHVATDRSDRP